MGTRFLLLCGPLWYAFWLFPPNLSAQSMNIDFGQPDNQPPVFYPGAGVPGFWNSFPAENTSTTDNLSALDGSSIGVTVAQVGGEATPHVVDPLVTGDVALLMSDYLVTFNPDLESCLFIRNLRPGWYQVILYAWMPGQPEVFSYTNCDEEPGNPHHIIGGAWPGLQLEGTTYAVHFGFVASDGPAAGLLQLHSGIVPEANADDGAALNGLQLRYLGGCHTDVSSATGDGPDGVTDQFDLGFVMARWLSGMPGADIAGPAATPAHGLDGEVDLFDLLGVVNAFGTCMN